MRRRGRPLRLRIFNRENLIGACGIGNYWILVIVISFSSGLGSAIDTFCSQLYGARDYRGLGIAFNRGALVVTITMIPFLLLTWEVERVFLLLGYPPLLAHNVGEYIRYQFPSIILEMEARLITKFLSSQRIYDPIFYASIVSAGTHLVGCFFLVRVEHLKLKGAAVAADCTSLIHFLLCYFYVKFNGRFALSWIPFNYHAFTKWREFFSVALPNAAMIIPEYIGLFVLGFEAGYLSSAQLTAHAILGNIVEMVNGVACGYAVCAGTLIGNSLGCRRIDLAHKIVRITLKYYYMVLLTIGMLIIGANGLVLGLFTRDKEVLGYAQMVLPIALGTQITDGLQVIYSAVLTGSGKTTAASIGNIVSSAMILHPIAIMLAFYAELGVLGLWIAWWIGTGCSAAFYIYVWRKLDLWVVVTEIGERGELSEEKDDEELESV